MRIKKTTKRGLLIIISLLILMLMMGNIIWLKVDIYGVYIPSYQIHVNLYGGLIVIKNDPNMEESLQLSSLHLPWKKNMELFFLAMESKGDEDESGWLDAIDVNIRIFWKNYTFTYGDADNENLDKLVEKLMDLSPIPVVDYAGEPIVPVPDYD